MVFCFTEDFIGIKHCIGIKHYIGVEHFWIKNQTILHYRLFDTFRNMIIWAIFSVYITNVIYELLYITRLMLLEVIKTGSSL